MKGTVDVFSLVLTGPDHAVGFGRQVVVAGLAPAGTTWSRSSRSATRAPAKTVKARPDGSFTVLFRASDAGHVPRRRRQVASPVVHVAA